MTGVCGSKVSSAQDIVKHDLRSAFFCSVCRPTQNWSVVACTVLCINAFISVTCNILNNRMIMNGEWERNVADSVLVVVEF